MKKCSSCKITKTLSNYTSNKAKRDGLSATCRECESFNRRYMGKLPPPKSYADYLTEQGFSKEEVSKYQRMIQNENVGLANKGG